MEKAQTLGSGSLTLAPIQVTPFELTKYLDMTVDQLKTYIQSQKDKFDQLRQQNTELNEKLHRQARKEKRMQEEQKQAVLQAETVNMMTKYQLVFVKMENQFAKIFNSNKIRGLRFKQEAFYRIKEQALLRQTDVHYKMHQVHERLRNKYLKGVLVEGYQRKLQRMLTLAYQKWRTHALLPKVAAKTEESNAKDIEGLKVKMASKEKELVEREGLVKQKENQIKQIMLEYKKLQTKIEEQEAKERQISQEIQALIYKNTTNAVENQKGVSSIYQRAQMLEQSLQQLKRENKTLREKLEMTELNMQSFIREMGGMLDQHQLVDTLGELMNEQMASGARSGGRGVGKQDEEGGGSTGGSIRRTKQ